MRVSLRELALVWFMLCGFTARGEAPANGFEAANKFYEQGLFTQAAAGYEALLQTGLASPAIYFNLGNACFKAGQIGRAIAAYHQAEQLSPRDPDLRANLQFARNQVQGPTLSPASWQRWLGRLSLNEWTLLASGAIWLWFLLLALPQWWPALKTTLRAYVMGLALVTLILCGCLAAALYQSGWGHSAVVIAREISVRQGPLDESQSAFTVHDGAELRVLDQKDDWLQVSTDPRRIGWLRGDQVLLLGVHAKPKALQKAEK
jgi:tetratricopeptide (TPR) repeat protein